MGREFVGAICNILIFNENYTSMILIIEIYKSELERIQYISYDFGSNPDFFTCRLYINSTINLIEIGGSF